MEGHDEPTIDEVVAAILDWRGRAIEVEPIPAGLTNRNYRVAVDGEPVFVRIPGPGTDLLAVDRGNELHNTRAAAAAGIGAPVLHHLPEWDALVLGWLPGRTMSNDAFAEPGMPARVAASLRRLHAGPAFRDRFDMFRTSERYLRVVDERGIRIPAGYRERMGLLPRLEAALTAHPLPLVPCHNDLLAENYLDDGETLWLIDYEYSGTNDPSFELGNTAQELGWGEDRLRELCAAYFGAATDGLLARMRLQMIMSDVGWTLWAAIQAAISPIDFDFFGWAEERWERARTGLDAPELAELVAAAATSLPTELAGRTTAS
jgi:thiamine kinase-like enzyme